MYQETHVFNINTNVPATNCDPDRISLWKHQSWQTEHTNIHVLKKKKCNRTLIVWKFHWQQSLWIYLHITPNTIVMVYRNANHIKHEENCFAKSLILQFSGKNTSRSCKSYGLKTMPEQNSYDKLKTVIIKRTGISK